jgi:hypothetical protein
MLRRRKTGGFLPAASPLSVEMGGEIEAEEDADEEEKKGVEYARPKKSIYVFIEGREKAKFTQEIKGEGQRNERSYCVGFFYFLIFFL